MEMRLTIRAIALNAKWHKLGFYGISANLWLVFGEGWRYNTAIFLIYRSQTLQFNELSLDKRLINSLDHLGLETPTEIQLKALPVAMMGKDLIASSKTGSGKTLAFLLPAMQRVLKSRALTKRDPRVLILAPTRELAKQVFTQLRALMAGTSVKGCLILGGENFNDQEKALAKDPHFVVATPGRLADHLTQRNLHLNGLELLIMDEADRMLDLGFAPQLRQVNNAADHRLRQTLMFSATVDNAEVNELAQELLKSPERISVGEANEPHKDIHQAFYLCDHLDHKQALLEHHLKTTTFQQAIIFTATREDTQRLAEKLSEQGYKAVALSGNLNQSVRNSIMDGFSRGQQQILVTTDVASRGLDLLNVSLVFNFDMPKHAEEYVHRIGRTGRAGGKGDAISFVGPKDWVNFKQVERYLKQALSFSAVDGLKAKFKGLKPKPVKGVKGKAGVKAKAKVSRKPVKKAPKKVNKTFHEGKEIGDAPMLRRKKKPTTEE